ncbi:MAG: glutamine amidotransferase-related protein [Minwuia sp.]|uniref:glutamine amidotransferase-related protein n=1 Tax=Minwuia sp. TaxID=2493630 RepID=UPI003A892F3F
MRNRIVVIRHGDDPPDDRVYVHLTSKGFEIDLRKPFAGETLDAPDERLAGTVLHGGPYTTDAASLAEHPFMREEDRWIGACMKADVPVLGICQGAQQIACHLGGTAGPVDGNPYEFGYYRVDPVPGAETFLDRPRWFTQAHFHMFSIPRGAERLATSEVFENQAFRYGEKAYGVQFHPEVTIEGFRRWQDAPWATYGQPGVQTREEQDRLMLAHDRDQAGWFHGFLDRLFGAPERA